MAQNFTDTYTELDEIDVDEADLDAEEGVELEGDVDAWMSEMLSAPSDRYNY
jgi:hypothetical protein